MDIFPPSMDCVIENRTFDEIKVGDAASLVRTLTQQDIELFAILSGDANPTHLNVAFARTDLFHKVVAHSMWSGGLFSGLLGVKLPGPGTVYLSQTLKFGAAVGLGDVVTASVTVLEMKPEFKSIFFDCRCVNQEGLVVAEGVAEILAPIEKIRVNRDELPDVRLGSHRRFRELLAHTAGQTALAVAVAHPCDALSLGAVVAVANIGLVVPILVGPAEKIAAAAKQAGVDISAYRLIDSKHSEESAQQAVALVRSGEASLLMKGSLHTDELMHAVMQTGTGLRAGRRLSHVYVMDAPSYPRPLLITDAVVNIAPDLAAKRDIVQNAIDLAHILGIESPHVAILAAVETVNPAMPATLDAAALCKMADRGQITGGVVDGPLAFDNAVSMEAALQKGIVSVVAGRADILVVPDLESGNMLAKQLSFLAGADAAGVVVGALAPIILTSRADSARTHIASCAVAVLMARAQQRKA